MTRHANSLSMDDLREQETALVFPQFTEETALEIGMKLVETAAEQHAPVVVDIRTPDRTLFHVALPGSTPDNDQWARRKSNVVLLQHRSSMLAGKALKASGEAIDATLDSKIYAARGGSFPIRVEGAGVIGAITISGLASEEDHALIVPVLARHLEKTGHQTAEAQFKQPVPGSSHGDHKT